MLASKLLSAAGGTEQIFSDEVFSSFLYTGNSSTQTINNGIDLAGKGGLVWCKRRNGINNHSLVDTERGMTFAGSAVLASEQTSGTIYTLSNWMRADSTGFSLGSAATGADINSSGNTYVSHTFRKSAKFFDCGTYTGNAGTLSISHALGTKPGFLVIKKTSAAGDWLVLARKSDGNIYAMYLNTTAAQFYDGTEGSLWNASTFSVNWINSNVAAGFNDNGATYVWYAFAHDTSAEGIIQCGSFTGNGSLDGPSITTGWETQFAIIKNTSAAADWEMQDVMRGMSYAQSKPLFANLSTAEGTSASPYVVVPTATGFKINNDSGRLNTSGHTYIYLAIRRPNKPPTSGTQVYNAIARTGTGAAATVTGVGFAPDLLIGGARYGSFFGVFIDKPRGPSNALQSNATALELSNQNALTSFDMDGATYGTDTSGWKLNETGTVAINWFFRRAPGVFDVVCYKGDDSSSRNIAHSLSAIPELVIVKNRTFAETDAWPVFGTVVGSNKWVNLHKTNAASAYTGAGVGGTASTFQVPNGGSQWNNSAHNYVAYLFASSPGISKVGSYTGNGSSQTIDCGFTTGCRFFLVKATSTTGSWWIFDSVRGVISAADPALQLNSAAAEITSADAVDPASVGIVVNQEATCSINASGVSYVYLALS